MILEDAQEFTAPDNPAFQLVSQTFLGQVPWRYTALDVKTYTILGPSIKAVSLYLLFNFLRGFSWCNYLSPHLWEILFLFSCASHCIFAFDISSFVCHRSSLFVGMHTCFFYFFGAIYFTLSYTSCFLFAIWKEKKIDVDH